MNQLKQMLADFMVIIRVFGTEGVLPRGVACQDSHMNVRTQVFTVVSHI